MLILHNHLVSLLMNLLFNVGRDGKACCLLSVSMDCLLTHGTMWRGSVTDCPTGHVCHRRPDLWWWSVWTLKYQNNNIFLITFVIYISFVISHLSRDCCHIMTIASHVWYLICHISVFSNDIYCITFAISYCITFVISYLLHAIYHTHIFCYNIFFVLHLLYIFLHPTCHIVFIVSHLLLYLYHLSCHIHCLIFLISHLLYQICHVIIIISYMPQPIKIITVYCTYYSIRCNTVIFLSCFRLCFWPHPQRREK